MAELNIWKSIKLALLEIWLRKSAFETVSDNVV